MANGNAKKILTQIKSIQEDGYTMWGDYVYITVANAFERVSGFVANVVQAVTDRVTDFIETAGNAIQDRLNLITNSYLVILCVNAWIGSIIAGITNLVGSIIKGIFGIIGDVLAGLFRFIGGILLWNSDLFIKGCVGICASITGAAVLVAGTMVSLIQRLLLLQNNERQLTQSENAQLRRIFYNSLSLYNVRIIEGWCGLFGINDRAFTLGNTIYMKNTNPSFYMEILVHECVHVWQYQNIGSRYTMDALGAQLIYGSSAYDWESELANGRNDWEKFNKEAQAELIQNIWTYGNLMFNGNKINGFGSFYDLQEVRSRFGNGTTEFKFNGKDYTALASSAVASVRGHINTRCF